jgi:hypothetical protein
MYQDKALLNMVCTQQVLLDDCSFFHHTLAQDCYILVTMFQNPHHKLQNKSCMTSCHNYHQLAKKKNIELSLLHFKTAWLKFPKCS